jgi:phosphoribosylglycinamide formyltransferase-1
MAAIIRACQEGKVEGSVKVVVAPLDDIVAATVAKDLGVYVAVISPESDSYGLQLLKVLSGCNLICLAGFTRLLPLEVLRAFPGRVLNIHPALLPKFGGKGMYGVRVHEAVLDSGDFESGCTVHLVTEKYDEGAIVLQRKCPVLPGDTPATLAARVLAEEHIAYVEAINRFN